MKDELTENEKQIRELAEQKNPYAKECPNRHLWSEGFIVGVNFTKDLVIINKSLLKTEQ